VRVGKPLRKGKGVSRLDIVLPKKGKFIYKSFLFESNKDVESTPCVYSFVRVRASRSYNVMCACARIFFTDIYNILNMKITHLFKEDLLIKDYGQFFKDKKNKVFDVRLVSFKFSEKKDKDICVYDV
jgi:hypothetical protein